MSSSAKAGPEERAGHAVVAVEHPRSVLEHVPGVKCRAHGAARVPARRLDPEVLERALAQDPTVGHAVEGDPAREAQVRFAGHGVRMAGHAQDHLLGDLLDRAREIHLPAGDLALGSAGRAAEEAGEAVVGHGQTVGISEVIEIQPEAAVGPQVEQVVVDLLDVAGLAVRREAHQLVLAAVDLEAGVVREGRVQQAEGVREVDLLEQAQAIAAAEAEGAGRPLPHAVEGEDGGAGEGRGEERAGGVRLVVLGEEDPAGLAGAGLAQLALDLGRDPQLLAQPDRHRLQERPQSPRRDRERGLEDALELGQGLVVEHHRVELARADAALGEAVAHGLARESRRRACAG